MKDREIYLSFIRIYLLHRAFRGPISGMGLLHELGCRGYRIGRPKLRLLLQRMVEKGYLMNQPSTHPDEGVRRLYAITARGRHELGKATVRVRQVIEMISARRG